MFEAQQYLKRSFGDLGIQEASFTRAAAERRHGSDSPATPSQKEVTHALEWLLAPATSFAEEMRNRQRKLGEQC